MANLLSQAIATDDLDAAVLLVATPLGITSGDVAAQAFSGRGNEAWAAADKPERAHMLSRWLAFECRYAAEDE